MKTMTVKMQWCDDGNDAQANDPSGNDDRCLSASSPSMFLLEVSFLRVMVSLNVGSPICLHGVKVFDQAVRLTYGTARRYERAAVVPLVDKASVAWFCGWLHVTPYFWETLIE
jgi:hypothetical protein